MAMLVLGNNGVAFGGASREVHEFYSQALSQNRTIHVHASSECSKEHRCPAIVFLPGWNQDGSRYKFSEALEKLLGIQPMIVVVPDGTGGLYTRTFYWNSATNGNHEDYIAKDVVREISNEYPIRTLATGGHDKNAWILAGFSMGGGGTRMAFSKSNPDLFSGLAAFSADLASDVYRGFLDRLKAENGGTCKLENILQYDRENPEAFQRALKRRFITYALLGAASSYSPTPLKKPFGEIPWGDDCGLREDVWKKWKRADAISMAEQYYDTHARDALGIYLRVDPADPVVPASFTEIFYRWLVENRVPVDYATHNNGHDFTQAMQEDLLVWASDHFAERQRD